MKRALWLGLAIVVAAAVGARAEPRRAGGLEFSDELGGFTLVSVSGQGSLADPFVVVEEVQSVAVLVVRGLDATFGNRIGTVHPIGFAVEKVLVNRTPFAWSFVEFELRQRLELGSDRFDGLSFGQGATAGHPFRSDRFAHTTDMPEPLDTVAFSDGWVAPGERARFRVVVTDTTPPPVFYLIQRPNRPLAAASPW